MLAQLILVAASIGSPAAAPTTCVAREPQLQVIGRSIPVNYPIEDAESKLPEGVVVLEIEVGEHGRAEKIALVCDTVGPKGVRAAEHAVRKWQFSAPAHAVGQLELRFTATQL